MKKRKPDYENTYSKSVTVAMLPSMMKGLEKTAKKRGVSKMQIVREALSKYLRTDDQTPKQLLKGE